MELDHYVTLGRSGLRVSPLCLGTLTFGNVGPTAATEEVSLAVIAEYADKGGNFYDTSAVYGRGAAEAILGKALCGNSSTRSQAVIATKFAATGQVRNPNGGGSNRAAIIRQCESSLRRLNTDYIDLYWQHWDDPFTPIEETMRALDDLVTSGKVRYVGFSDTPVWKVAQAQTIAQFRGWAPLIALQLEYSLLERTVESDFVPLALEMGMGITPWAPLAGGALSGKYQRGNAEASGSGRAGAVAARMAQPSYDAVEVARKVAAARDIPMAHVALAWLLARPGVTAPVIGVRTIEQFRDNILALQVQLTADEIAELDAASTPPLQFPHPLLKMVITASYPGMMINGHRIGHSHLAPVDGKDY